jgi:putative membrane protein
MSDGDPTDAQVRGVLALLDRGEIDAARLAQTKARDAQVRQYAATMVQAHERSLAQVGTGTRGTAGDLVTPVVEMQQKTLQRMQTLAAGPDFDRDFMARQMEAHEGTLQMLDRLEQSARSTALVGQIRQRKRDVEHHIEQTRAILNVVSRPPVGMSDPGLAAPRGGFYYSESAQPGAAGGAARAGAQPVTPANTRTGAPTAVAPGADAQGAARNPASSVPATQSPRTTPATTPSP